MHPLLRYSLFPPVLALAAVSTGALAHHSIFGHFGTGASMQRQGVVSRAL